MVTPLLRTKLYIPPPRPNLVPRPRLFERLNAGLHGKLTLISAPAGFGKTTLLSEWIASCERPVAWLSLDEGDNDPTRFFTYLVAALQTLDPNLGQAALGLLRSPQPPSPEAVVATLINDIAATPAPPSASSRQRLVLALDDYHTIVNLAVHEAAAFLLERQPPQIHVVIITRQDPLLPLSRLRARGQMTEFRTSDLQFTDEEAAAFLNQTMGLNLAPGEVAALEARTEGWIAGLQLAALSLQNQADRSAFVQAFSGDDRHVMDYLLDEVLSRQPEAVQTFLLRTSILERLSGPLCDAVTEGGEESQAILEYLERANLFIVPLDNRRCWYRYHHLFADLLRARLHHAQPDLAPLLHIRASVWLEQNGFITEAIHHLFTAHEIERAADLIERYGPEHLAESDPSVLQMADSLPQEIVLARPQIGLYQAWHLIIQGRIGKARPLLNDMARQLAGTDPQSGQQWMQTIVSLALAFLSPLANTPPLDPLPDYLLWEEIPAEEPLLRNAADFLYAMALGRQGELDRAAEVAVKCIQREKTSRGAMAIPTLAPFLTRIYLMQGRLRAAASLCHEFLDPIKERDIRFIYTAGSMKIDLGEVLYEWNCLEGAEQHIRDGLRANEVWRNIMTDGFGLVALTRVLQAKGDYAGAMQVVEKFETRLSEHSRPREFDEDFYTLRVRMQLARGDLRHASRWADQIHLSEGFDLHKERYRLTLARIRLRQSRYAEVEKLLAGTTPLAAAGSRITRQLESNLLLAVAIAGQQRLPEALGLIESCLTMAGPEGYIRIFLDVGESVRELLAAYLRSDSPAHKLYAQKVLDAFPPLGVAGSPRTQSGGLVEPLSGRELEVLHLIARGRTNQEIARQLIIAPGTVKAHTSSIYRKLDVANRTEAVARARQLGILP